jgi:hypothetical protein
MVSRNFLIFFAPILDASHGIILERPLPDQFCSSVVIKLGAECKSEPKLSFALLFGSSHIFCEKNYLKFSLKFLVGDMQLLGRCYLCYQWCRCGDPQQYLAEQHCG